MNQIRRTGMMTMALLFLALVFPQLSFASSHFEAPGVFKHAACDGTDVYFFRSPDAPDTVTLIGLNYGLLEPVAGPNFARFNEDCVYQLLVSNDGGADPDITYEFRFQTEIVAPDQVLAYLPGSQGIEQTFTLFEIRDGKRMKLGTGTVPAPRVGSVTTPNYQDIMKDAIFTFDGIKVFVGPVEDPFYVDLHVFDALTIRKVPGNDGGGKDSTAGFNVLATALQIPISRLKGNSDILGVWQQSFLPRNAVQTTVGPKYSGRLISISRLGAPLVNELIIPLKNKERWNSSKPVNDAQFLPYVLDPQAAQLITAVYGIPVPPPPRNDLVAIFLTGIQGLNQPPNVVPSEQLRLNTSTPVTRNPKRLGVLAGDLQGYPNGRRLMDDVVDITLQAAAGATPFTPEFNRNPNNLLGDGVDQNDVPFGNTFPYLGVPFNPATHRHHRTEK